jgi:2,3,4,5-tetrahydropyridine-2,6-dicarboxylate N-succinyltransferase
MFESVEALALAEQVSDLYRRNTPDSGAEEVFREFLTLLDAGEIRAAEKIDNIWHVNRWVKEGILLGFRLGVLADASAGGPFSYFDKHTYPVKKFTAGHNVRIVPGGTSVRMGAYVAPSVIIMPPAYINVGAHIGANTMIDSHALVGSCAQVGERVHVSAAAQIGGVLEPAGALPVIIEDDVLIGGNCGIYEGTVVSRRAVIGSGTIITGSTPVYDCVREQIISRNEQGALIIPEGAVVVAGSRPANSQFAMQNDLSIYTPLIVKYRDAGMDAKTALEMSLR